MQGQRLNIHGARIIRGESLIVRSQARTERIDGPPEHRDASTHRKCRVDIALIAKHVVDVSGIRDSEPIGPERQYIRDQGHVHQRAYGISAAASRNVLITGFHLPFEFGQIRGIGYILYQATHGTRAVQSSLRALQYFDPLHIEQIRIRSAGRTETRHRASGGGRVIEIGCYGRSGSIDAGGDATEDLQAVARLHLGDLQTRHERREVLNGFCAELVQHISAEHGERCRHLQGRFFAARCRHDDLLNIRSIGRRVSPRACDLSQSWRRNQTTRQGGDRANDGARDAKWPDHTISPFLTRNLFLLGK